MDHSAMLFLPLRYWSKNAAHPSSPSPPESKLRRGSLSSGRRRIAFRAEALGNQRDVRPGFFAGRSKSTSPTRDTPLYLHKPLSLSRLLHFHRSLSLVYRDHPAISYRDRAHTVPGSPSSSAAASNSKRAGSIGRCSSYWRTGSSSFGGGEAIFPDGARLSIGT